MRLIDNQRSVQNNYDTLQEIIGDLISDLKKDQVKNQKKILEVCHVGKFLMLLGDDIKIDRLFERPDFIIASNQTLIGLEHQIIVDKKSKEYEGFYENIFSLAQAELRDDHELPNFLANCYLWPNLTYRLTDKPRLIKLVKDVVKKYVLTGMLLQNSLIYRIAEMPHTEKTLSPNLGAWWQKSLTTSIIQQAVSKKELNMPTYINNSGPIQWLLLVIGGLKNSSYELDIIFDLEINTSFQKVYLLEDFRNRLFELK